MRASHLSHSCNSCRVVNVIDENETIEIRTIRNIPAANVPSTLNFLHDICGTGIIRNDDINLIPCNIHSILNAFRYRHLDFLDNF